jgi:hypothetical protein
VASNTSPGAADSLKAPAGSVRVVTFLPFIDTDTPGSPIPAVSLTVPLTIFCEKAKAGRKRNNISKRLARRPAMQQELQCSTWQINNRIDNQLNI